MPPLAASSGPVRRGRKAPDTGRGGAIARFFPVVVLPVAVFVFQQGFSSYSGSGLPMVFLATALGALISAAVKNGVLAAFTTTMSLFLLLSASYVQELQATEGQQAEPLTPGAAAPRAADGPAGLVAVAGEDGGGQALAGLAPAKLETLSVVLPCAFEGEYAWKTVEAIRRNTLRHRLLEIIVVDDGSKPPLEPQFPQKVLRGTGDAPVHIIRHEKTIGLIGSKKAGGDVAKGDVIVFFDCHVNPRKGWEEAFLKQMTRAGDHRTLVVPTITSLDPETWREIGGSNSKACYLLWSADFTWLSSPGRDVPLMSGGLLALSRRWWQETGGLDPHMIAWGGENIDQSLRAWLCGGRIEVAEGAFVAHMWRDQNNPKTQLKYPMPTEDVMRNKARAVMAWMDEFQNKTLSFPEYEDFLDGRNQVGDMSNFAEIKRNLQCKPFSHYITRFSYVYLDTGLIPAEVFQLREETTGRCLERQPRAHMPHGIVLAHCAGEEGGGVAELQLWHAANRDRSQRGAPCCSGLANWNFIQCLDGRGINSNVETFECEIQGYSSSQNFQLKPSGTGVGSQVEWSNGQGCLAPKQPKGNQEQTGLQGCGFEAEWLAEQGRFRLRTGSGRSCITAVTVDGADAEASLEAAVRLEAAACADGDERQVFESKAMFDGILVKAVSVNLCLDAAGGSRVLAYPCYEEDKGNQNQIWELRGGKTLIWEGPAAGGTKAFCLQESHSSLRFHEVQVGHKLVLRSCAPKVGQRLRREEVAKDGTFLLKDQDTGKCLTNGGSSGGLETQVKLGTCGSSQRWRAMEDRQQVQHVQSTFCLDAGDEVTPILYPCHQPKAQRKQRFKVVDDPGWLMLMSGWEDNGRKRYFDMCFDHAPEPLVEVTLDRCHTAREQGVRWTRINARVPVEMQLWQKAQKPPPGDIGLGGGAAPP